MTSIKFPVINLFVKFAYNEEDPGILEDQVRGLADQVRALDFQISTLQASKSGCQIIACQTICFVQHSECFI